MAKTKKWALGYLTAFISMIFLNYWSATDVGIVANQDQAIIQPAGFAFSIWGLIYLLLFIWIIRLFFVNQNGDSPVKRLTFWPILNFVLNGLWIIAFTQEWLLLSVLIIAALLITLIMIYSRITQVNTHWFNRVPFSIYFGWVTVATIVNIFTWVKAMNRTQVFGLSELTWTIIMLVAATGIAVWISLKFSDWIFPLVLIWSYSAILVEQDQIMWVFMITIIGCIITQITVSTRILYLQR